MSADHVEISASADVHVLDRGEVSVQETVWTFLLASVRQKCWLAVL